MNNTQWQIEKIIEVANGLQRTGSTAASTGERIAAAFRAQPHGLLAGHVQRHAGSLGPAR